MAIYGVTVPKWGLSMEEGKIVHWHVGAGAAVRPGDPLVDIETSKITNTLEAAQAGVIRRILADLEDVRACGALIAVLDDAGASENEIDSFIERAPQEAALARAETAAAASEPQFVELDRIRLRYLSMGEGKTPVVLLHGFGGDLNNWLFNQPVLAADRRVIAIDLPGHGGSGKSVSGGTVEEIAGIMAEAITSLELTRLHLVGHSLGGAVALALAARQLHDSIASLALIAPVGLGQQVNRNFVTGFIEARKRRELQKVLELLFANPALVTPDMADDVLRFKRLDGAEDALRKIAEANFSEDGLAVLLSLSRDLHSPATVIWGLADKVVPAPPDDEIRATYERLPGVGHMPHMEAAAVVNRLLASHFAGNE